MIFTLSLGNRLKERLKLSFKLILLALIICYILPKLFMLLLDFNGHRLKTPDEYLLEKPLRVMAHPPDLEDILLNRQKPHRLCGLFAAGLR